MSMEMRAFQPAEITAIAALFETVFTEAESAAEGKMVGHLAHEMMTDTADRDLYGFVAIEASTIIGAILFSRLTFTVDVEAFILSPVGVHSSHQGQGTGTALIRHGLEQLRNDGVQVVTTYGDPDYYTRLGFQPLAIETLAPPFELSQPIGWLGQSLNGDSIEPIAGLCRCVSALNHPEYW